VYGYFGVAPAMMVIPVEACIRFVGARFLDHSKSHYTLKNTNASPPTASHKNHHHVSRRADEKGKLLYCQEVQRKSGARGDSDAHLF
jgi:hypothetical protein